MKKITKQFVLIFFSIFLVSIAVFFACKKIEEINKSDTLIHSNGNNPLKSMGQELAILYEQVPKYDFGNITLIHGDILKFESREHYEQVYESLLDQWRAWTKIFISNYDNGNEKELDEIIMQLGFDDRIPMLKFEEQFGIADNNLRTVKAIEEDDWLARGAIGSSPIDEVIKCPVEKTFFSKYHEICIGDTICQARTDGYVILIPTSAVGLINSIRSTSSSDLLRQASGMNLRILPPEDPNRLCNKSKHSISRTRTVDSDYKFDWFYEFGSTWWYKIRVQVGMSNYKKNGTKWDKERQSQCALCFTADLWEEVSSSSCQYKNCFQRAWTTTTKTFSKSRTENLKNYFNDPSKARINPGSSEAIFFFRGWHYNYNVETGNLKVQPYQ